MPSKYFSVLFELVKNISENAVILDAAPNDAEFESFGGRFIELPDEVKQLFQMYGAQRSGKGIFFGNQYDGFEGMSNAYSCLSELFLDGDELNVNTTPIYPEDTIKEVWFSEKWFPISGNKCGNYIFYDTDPSSLGKVGQIITVCREDECHYKVADSLEEFFLLIIDMYKIKLHEEFSSLYDAIASGKVILD